MPPTKGVRIETSDSNMETLLKEGRVTIVPIENTALEDSLQEAITIPSYYAPIDIWSENHPPTRVSVSKIKEGIKHLYGGFDTYVVSIAELRKNPDRQAAVAATRAKRATKFDGS